jgi:hypothetical protein
VGVLRLGVSVCMSSPVAAAEMASVWASKKNASQADCVAARARECEWTYADAAVCSLLVV